MEKNWQTVGGVSCASFYFNNPSSWSLSPHSGDKIADYPASYPGESPINIEPAKVEIMPSSMATFNLESGFSLKRNKLTMTNNGHYLKVTVCGENGVDCAATATFAGWPRYLHHHGVSTVKKPCQKNGPRR